MVPDGAVKLKKQETSRKERKEGRMIGLRLLTNGPS